MESLKQFKIPIQEGKSNIINKVIELQKECNEYVTEQSPEFLMDLYNKGLLKVELNENGEIIGTFYKQPLDKSLPINDPNQIFRIGGLSITSSTDKKRNFIFKKMFKRLKEEVENKNMNIIAKTENEILAKFLKKVGLEEITFEELKDKYKRFIDLYTEMSIKNEEQYRGKKFYIRKV